MKSKIIAPSILSADFTNLGSQILELQNANCKLFHCDVMDGIFVPNISFGSSIISQVNKITTVPLDTHLMITEPIRYIKNFSDAGSKYITIHYEACNNLSETIKFIKSQNVKVGVSIKPKTQVSVLKEFIKQIDLVLIMSVEPGFGGQSFIPTSIEKIVETKNMISENNVEVLIEVDGGINFENAKQISDSGADILVAGNTIFKTKNYVETFLELQKLIS